MLRKVALAVSLLLLAALEQLSAEDRKGPVFSLAIVPSAPNSLFAGVGVRGIFRTIDAGKNWTPCSSGLPKSSVTTLWVDPARPQVVLAGIKYWDAYRSEDSGATWIKLSLCALEDYPAIAFLPGEPAAILAGGASCGVMRSDDHGLTWARLFATTGNFLGGTPRMGLDCGLQVSVVKVEDIRKGSLLIGTMPSEIYCPNTLGPGLFRAALKSGEIAKVPFRGWDVSDLDTEPGSPATILAAGGAIFRSTDRGKTWEVVLSSSRMRLVRFAPLVSGLAFAATLGGPYWEPTLFRSTDHGASWTQIETPFGTVYQLVFDPKSTGILFAATNQGVYRSGDGGSTWEERSNGLP